MTSPLLRLLRLVAPAVLLGVAVPVVGPALTQPAFAGAGSAAAATDVPAVAAQLLSLTNSARVHAGLPALTSSATLASLARGWSQHMAAAHQLSHNPGLAGAVAGWSTIGENVAEAPAGATAATAQALFLGSPDHRANILDPAYNRVGIGVTRASDGTMWFTVDFEQTAGYHPPARGTTPVATTKPKPRPPSRATAGPPAAATARAAAAARTNRSLVRGPALTAGATTGGAQGARLAEVVRHEDATSSLGVAGSLPPAAWGARTASGAGQVPGPPSPAGLVALSGVALAVVLGSVGVQARLRRDRPSPHGRAAPSIRPAATG